MSEKNFLVLATRGIDASKFLKLFGACSEYENYYEAIKWEKDLTTYDYGEGIHRAAIITENIKLNLFSTPNVETRNSRLLLSLLLFLQEPQRLNGIIAVSTVNKEDFMNLKYLVTFKFKKLCDNIIYVIVYDNDINEYNLFLEEQNLKQEKNIFPIVKYAISNITNKYWPEGVKFFGTINNYINENANFNSPDCPEFHITLPAKLLLKSIYDLIELLIYVYICAENNYIYRGCKAFVPIESMKSNITACYGPCCVSQTFKNDEFVLHMKQAKICHGPCKCTTSDVSNCIVFGSTNKVCFRCHCDIEYHSRTYLKTADRTITSNCEQLQLEKSLVINILATFHLYIKQNQEIYNFEKTAEKLLIMQEPQHVAILNSFKQDFNKEVKNIDEKCRSITHKDILTCLYKLFKITKLVKNITEVMEEIIPKGFKVDIVNGGLTQQNEEPESTQLMFKTMSNLSVSSWASKSWGNEFAATTSALPFGLESQLSDLPAMSSLSQGLNQPGLTPSAYQQPPVAVSPQLLHHGQSGLVNTSLPQNTFVASLAQLQQQQQPQISNFLKDAGASTQPTFASTVSITSFSTATNTSSFKKVMPVNVVITSSEPLPTTKSVTTPQVTISLQHLKGNHNRVHNYQIPLPTTSATVTTVPSVLNQSPMPLSTQSLISNIAPPVYSAIGDKSPNKNISLGFQIEKSMNQTKSSIDIDILNRSGTSVTSQDERDPFPDFKPVIPLPDEVPVNTGEENENVLFCERAKLYRYTNKEWKERGIGDLKILRNPDTEKIRLIMRRDQVHKICANHYITPDMSIMPMSKNEKAYIWAANDYAEGEVVLEKFSVQFKNPEIAKKFKQEFENAKIAKPSKNESQNKIHPQTTTPQPVTKFGGFKFTSERTFLPKDGERTPPVEVINDSPKTSPFALFSFTKDNKEKAASTISETSSKSNLFPSFSFAPAAEKNVTTPSFTSSPMASFTFSSSGDNKPFSSLSLNQNDKSSDIKTKPFSPFSTDENKSGLVKPSPISISFNKSISDTTFTPVQNQDISSSVKITSTVELNESTGEDFIPTAEFKPVIPLPDLVDVKTGEENAEILFESKAKLLRYDSKAKGWKERGIGQMKILKESTIRLLMRRDQVHKVCCNHQLLKNMEFSKMKTTVNAVTWCAKDFSEAVFTNECFAIRFKTEELALKFLDTLQKAKQSLDENNVVESEARGDNKRRPIESEPMKAPLGWADKFKATWNCRTCYIANDQKVNYCVACDSPKDDNIPKKQSDAQFCFGVAQKAQTPTAFSFGGGAITTQSSDAKDKSQGFGDTFKPKKDSWECTSCYTRNDGDKVKCLSCETPKDGTQPKPTSLLKSEPKGIDLSTGGLKFNFGMPATTAPVSQSNDEKPTSTTTPSANPGFGDAFKPKVGSWECKECYTRNDSDYCLACECPKDDTIPIKANKANKGVDLSTGAQWSKTRS